MAYYDQACVQQHSMMGFHDKCYRRFIDSKHIAARKRTVPEETPYDFKRRIDGKDRGNQAEALVYCLFNLLYVGKETIHYSALQTVQDKLQQAETFDGEQSLPPTKDALIQHVKRCTNQAAIHSRALQQRIDALSPEGHGWKLENDDLIITWMTKPPDPDVLLQCVSSSCRVGKCLKGRCS
ncbi:hypothetical protein BSL78_07488 [Apostichopus japonicus]|uniref:Uncharacterized protein n=1 Tax=Stichopus japonicus TaxID=307972 RepID=A0A2G8L5P9_STIJA|nr:hypothetical protein BSL78_08121 [Apostichopus japonicus]PIK55586.1 hypothetical protein BSL78_07488 [Apostichopus japonicus]